MPRCDYLIPSHYRITHGIEPESCLLPYGHTGNHLNRMQEERYLSWNRDEGDCDENCSFCGECFHYDEIDKTRALRIMRNFKKDPSPHD